MRILIAPLCMPLPTMGPAGRTISLAAEAVRRGHEIAVCAALDGNLKPEALPPETDWLPAPMPVPLGLPRLAGRLLLVLMNLAGMSRRAKVTSFEQVLFLGGHLHLAFFLKYVEALRQAIRRFQPHVFFSEYCFEAIATARLENLPVCGTHSFPGRAQFASSPQFSKSIRQWLKDQGVGPLDSVLSLYEEQVPRFVASSQSLEPFPDEVIHVGPLTAHPTSPAGNGQPSTFQNKDAVVVYMGNGSLPIKKLAGTLSEAFERKPRQIYIAADGKKKQPHPNVYLAPRFDFSELLPRAEVFVNHGGQNSVMDGLLAGVPQVMIPGNVFERDYNASSVERIGAGKNLALADFNPQKFNQTVEELIASGAAVRASQAGAELASLGGAAKVLEVLENLFGLKI